MRLCVQWLMDVQADAVLAALAGQVMQGLEPVAPLLALDRTLHVVLVLHRTYTPTDERR